MDSAKVKKFQSAVIDFWDSHGRKDLPWRLTSDPWRILLAEVLLRKTTSRQVAGIYEAVAGCSPKQLADMRKKDLETLLKPMGMYRVRAKQIRSLADAVSSCQGESLKNPEFLRSLPGIGRYACNTVMCFAFNTPKPALDTNMIRVISRVFGMKSNRSRAREDKNFWQFAEALVPPGRCREFNWGVLDFARDVCKPRSPKCDGCIMLDICDFASSIAEQKVRDNE